MDLRQLNALLAVAAHGSFSAAARALHTVQSNVSSHIARLEREVGSPLIDRTTGQLTEEGEVVAARARRIQGELDALAADVASLHDQITGSVTLGMIGTTGRWLAPIVLEAMAAAHPMVRLVVVDATTTSLLPRLLGGQLDLAVVNLPVTEADLVTEELFTEDTILLAPTRHPLANHQRVGFADLDGVPLLLEPVGTTFRALLEAQADEAGIALVAQAEVDGMRLLASLAFEGFGATLVPATAVPRWLPAGDWRGVSVDGLRGRSVGLAQRRRGLPSAPARALVEVVRQVVTDEAHHQPGVSVAHALSAR
jgi:DNA-binding transcriptional LysR family regulator